MNGKITIGDMQQLVKDSTTVAAAIEKASRISSFANTGGSNAQRSLSASLTVHGSHGSSTPLEMGPEIMQELTHFEYVEILRTFARAQERIIARMANDMKSRYGMTIEGITSLVEGPVVTVVEHD